MQNGKKKVLALLLAGCCVLSACGTKQTIQNSGEGKFVTGTVECKEVYVRAKIPGYLTDIPVEEGRRSRRAICCSPQTDAM